MKVDLLHSFAWDEINESLDQQLGAQLGKGGAHRIYQGLSQAVFEIVMGTALFYSHRKYYGILTGDTWAFDPIIPNLLKDGFQSQAVRAGAVDGHAAGKGSPGPKDWVASLSKETGFVLWSEDHPVLATYDAREELDAALNAARIISIRVSHQAFQTRPQDLRPYSVRICSLAPDLALAQVGARFKSPPLFSHRMYWDKTAVLKRLPELLRGRQDRAAVEKFEEQFDGSARVNGLSRWPIVGERIYDRALIFHPEVSSEFVAQSLASASGVTLKAPGFESNIEIVNRCRWQPAPGFSSWWDPKPRDEMLAGLLILSLDQIARPEIVKELVGAVSQGEFKFEPSP